MHVVKPGPDFRPESFRFDDFGAYYRLVRRRLEEVVGAPPDSTTYPYPVPHCDVCRWWQECEARRHADDHLCLVAGIRPLHVGELEAQGVRTLRQFAESPQPLARKPARGSPEAFARAHGQARIQLEGRMAGQPRYRFLPVEPERGFARLPAPDAGDLFFDFEADPFAGEAGLEYLFGVAFADEASEAGGGLRYRAWWALDAGQERAALEAFLDFVMERWAAHPGLHIYHFSPYEPAAVKRLIGRHGTREAEVDRLLRAGRFVDLMAVTRQGLQASVESYSLKELEALFGFERAMDLRAAGAALRRVARALELAGPDEITAADRAQVEAYNRDDCLSTAALRDWLEERREELERQGQPDRPARGKERGGQRGDRRAGRGGGGGLRAADPGPGRGPLELGPRAARALASGPSAGILPARGQERLVGVLPDPRPGSRRAAGGAQGDRRPALPGRGRRRGRRARGSLVHRYSFPAQEAAAQPGDELHEIGGEAVGRVHALDLAARTLEIAKYRKAAALHPAAVMVNERVSPKPVDGALLQFARTVAWAGARGPHAAGWDLLAAARPRLSPAAAGPLRRPGEDGLKAAVRLVRSLDSSILPIQGPPGSGKTYTGARMIAALGREGCSIGVTAVSHKVIRNLLGKALEAAREAGLDLRAVHKISRPDGEAPEGVEQVGDNAQALALLKSGAVVGGTAWFWSRDELTGSVDYLFVDEAGQISLAQALAMSRAARNLVLLGDPQQLEQPQRGAHPEGAEVAALVHLLGGRQTIAEEAGLFLDETWRLHPAICAFTSELFYEGRLRSRPGLENQALGGDTPFAGSGLFYVPVEHAGNQASSPEEAEAVARIVKGLLAPAVRWTAAGREGPAPAGSRHPGGGPVQRPGGRHRPAAAGGAGGHRGQVPGAGGARGHLLDGQLLGPGCAARHGLPVQPQPPERGHQPGAGSLHPGGRAARAGAGVPQPGADAAGQRPVPLPGAGRRGADRPLTIAIWQCILALEVQGCEARWTALEGSLSPRRYETGTGSSPEARSKSKRPRMPFFSGCSVTFPGWSRRTGLWSSGGEPTELSTRLSAPIEANVSAARKATGDEGPVRHLVPGCGSRGSPPASRAGFSPAGPSA